MASEPRRYCGYRKVGGLYLVAGGIWDTCDRLPYEVCPCPVCGGGIHFPRSPRQIDPTLLFGQHYESAGCTCPTSCRMCNPVDSVAYLMGVGEKYYSPKNFIEEASRMGISKRVPAVPKNLVLGKTWIYLVHRRAITTKTDGTAKDTAKMAIFCAFVPQRIELLVWQSDLTPAKKAALEKRGITPVIVPDGDTDHAPRKKRKESALSKQDVEIGVLKNNPLRQIPFPLVS